MCDTSFHFLDRLLNRNEKRVAQFILINNKYRRSESFFNHKRFITIFKFEIIIRYIKIIQQNLRLIDQLMNRYIRYILGSSSIFRFGFFSHLTKKYSAISYSNTCCNNKRVRKYFEQCPNIKRVFYIRFFRRVGEYSYQINSRLPLMAYIRIKNKKAKQYNVPWRQYDMYNINNI